MKISKLQYTIYTNKLNKVEENIKELTKDLQAAVALGDLSENEEYHSVKAALSEANLERSKLRELLKSEIIDYDTSNIITLGSLVKISSPCMDKDEILMVGESGSTPIEPIINVDSNVGKAILGQVSGEFRVGDNIFIVTKIEDPDFDKFAESYLDEDTALTKLLDVWLLWKVEKRVERDLTDLVSW